MMGWNSAGGMGSLGWLGMGNTGDSALDILDARLANGQLDMASWQAQRAALLSAQDVTK